MTFNVWHYIIQIRRSFENGVNVYQEWVINVLKYSLFQSLKLLIRISLFNLLHRKQFFVFLRLNQIHDTKAPFSKNFDLIVVVQ